MNNPNISGLNDLSVLASRRTFGVNRVSRVFKAVKDKNAKFKAIITNVQLWMIVVLVLCSIFTLIAAWDEGDRIRYRTIVNLVCVFIAYICSYIAFSYIKKHTNKQARDQININDIPVQVHRNGRPKTIPLSEVVVNDIVILEEGSFVPADGILVRSAGISVDESNVGGNNDVSKRVGAQPNKSTVYPSDWMICGSVVIEGNGLMKVTRVGNQTEYGKSTNLETSNVDSRIPYVYLIDRTSKVVATYILIYSILILGICYFIGSTETLYSILMIPTNFIVSVLPIVVPYAMAIINHLANKRIANMGVKVRDLNTPYALGMTSTIITGRFGVISNGMMTVTKVFLGCNAEKDAWLPLELAAEKAPEVLSLFHKALSLATTAGIKDHDNPNKRHITGAAEETAIISWLYDNNVDVHHLRLSERAIDRVLSMRDKGVCGVLVEGEEENYVFVHGRPKEVLSYCRYVMTGEGRVEIDEYVRLIYKAAKAESPYMVSVAYARVPSNVKKIDDASLGTIKLTLMGLIYIDDSIREGVKEFVSSMRNTNIDVRLVTSLRKESAALLAAKSNVISEEEALNTEGVDSVCKTTEEIKQYNQGRIPYDEIKKMKVISQVSLSDRVDMIKSLKNNGEIVMIVSSENRVEQVQDMADVFVIMRRANSDTHRGDEVSINKDHLRTLRDAIGLGKMLIRSGGRLYSYMLGLSVALLLLNTIGMLTCGSAIMSIIQIFWLDVVAICTAAIAIAFIQNDRSINTTSISMYNSFATKTDFTALAILYAVFEFGFVFVFWLMAAKMDLTQVSDLWHQEIQFGIPTDPSVQFTVHERTMIMTLMVMCTFWSLIVSRVFGSSESIFYRIRHYWKFYLTTSIIPICHFVLVYFNGDLVLAKSETVMDWVYLMAITSVILIYVEIRQLVRRCILSRKRK
ncbi:MAG: cation transporting ATPase C-terminal domain-containing protein [Bacteroidia bacterium]|nr:cation transporting ATPase C-terminal domain-containing protein [Bacteroidia bacterium]